MAKFFNYYPKTYYTSNNNSSSLDTVTNIVARFGFEDKLKENSSAFYKYSIKDSDTPEIIADKFYGNVERHWIVLLFNDIIDPQYNWPLDSRTLIKYIDKKYSANQYADTANTSVTGISWAQNISHVQAYYKIITRTSADGTDIVEKITVDANTYANIAATSISYTLNNASSITQTVSKTSQTYYDYELELNEAKREIKLLKGDFVSEVEKEFKRVITT
jgi:hypothetical protein